ncbi:S8 family serine peptidase [Thermodesulfobacteriota bacterium]
MKKRTALMAMLIMLAGMLFSGNICVAQTDFRTKGYVGHASGRYVPGEVVVRFHPGASDEVIAKLNRTHGTAVLSTSRVAGFKRLRVPKGKTVAEMVAIYRHNPNVEYAEPNFIAHALDVPNDPFYSYQWHMDNDAYGGIHLNAARDRETGSDNVIVAVIDTGVAYENYEEAGVPIGRSGKFSGGAVFAQAPDLANTIFVPGYDFVNNDEHPNDDEGHGTHVAGTIAQSTDNVLGVAGIAPGCAILPVKVLDNTGSGTYTDIAEGIYFAADNGAKVINMSLGGTEPSVTLEYALAYAHGAGLTIVCASGNDSATTVNYPAAYDNYCIAVGATRYDETVSWYSNHGVSLDLTAPGGDLTVDQNGPDIDEDGIPDGDGYGDGVLQQTHDGSNFSDFGYYFYQGTSMAAPHVAGVAALLLSQADRRGDNDLSPAEVQAILQASAEDHGSAGWDSVYGWGLVDAEAAILYYLENADAANQAPIADPGGPYDGNEDAAVLFDGSYDAQTGSGSYDPDGDTITYIWDFGDGVTGAGAIHAHTYGLSGTYTVTLVVNDGKVDSEPATTEAVISEVNDAPVADAGPDMEVPVGEPVGFDGSNSFDEEGDELTYVWDFDDGGGRQQRTQPLAHL